MSALNNLNKEQLEAVKYIEGPIMVFAGAGTGKTRTLTSRIIYMVEECHINPKNILAITFTNKATKEMKTRVVEKLNTAGNSVNISTIHSLCARILRRNIQFLGYQKDFEIIDEDEQQKILSDIFKENKVERKVFSPKTAIKIISDYKNGRGALYGMVSEMYTKYQEYMKENNLIDFDDLLVLTKELFLTEETVLKYYQELFQYIMVDEFQDTDELQYSIIKLLCESHRNIFVVGDDDQSIYSFRGACVENMFQFKKDFPDAKIVKLTQNYRSSNAILKGANAVISNNTIREQKELHSEIESKPNSVVVQETYYYDDEARFAASEITHMVQKGYCDYKDIAVIYRNSVLSRSFELEFINSRIPYNIYGGFSYMKRKEVKDILSYFRFIVNPTRSNHFKRIINQPARGIGDKTLSKLYACMEEQNLDLFNAIDYVYNESPSTKNAALKEFKDAIVYLQSKLEEVSLIDFFDLVVEKTGYLEMLEKENDEDNNRIDNLNDFKSILLVIDEFYGEEFTQEDKIKYGFDDIILEQDQKEEKNPNGVVLSTVHSIKGLEFKVVFVVGLEEGIFPSAREDIDMEEERRVAYVAFTRAKERIYLTCSTTRLIYGRVVRNPKSRFLIEYLSAHKELTKEKPQEATPKEITDGTRVFHDDFGPGLVISTTEIFFKILFDRDQSLRNIMKGHAKLRPYTKE